MKIIAHISDVHFGRVLLNSADTLLADLREIHPDFIVVSGDLTQRARAGQFRKAAAFLRALPAPFLVIPGNHDIPLYNIFRRFISPFGRYRRFITADLAPAHFDDQLAIIGITTPIPFRTDGGIIDADRLAAARRSLDAIPPNRFRIVVTHHPLIPTPGERPDDVLHGAGPALACFEACAVDMLLSGHRHLTFHGDVRTHHAAVRRSILSIHAGTATSTRLRRNEPNSYNVITIADPNHVMLAVRSRTAGRFQQVDAVAFQRIDGIWTPQQPK